MRHYDGSQEYPIRLPNSPTILPYGPTRLSGGSSLHQAFRGPITLSEYHRKLPDSPVRLLDGPIRLSDGPIRLSDGLIRLLVEPI